MIHRLFLGYCRLCSKELKVSRIQGCSPCVFQIGDYYYCQKCYNRLDRKKIEEFLKTFWGNNLLIPV